MGKQREAKESEVAAEVVQATVAPEVLPDVVQADLDVPKSEAEPVGAPAPEPSPGVAAIAAENAAAEATERQRLRILRAPTLDLERAVDSLPEPFKALALEELARRSSSPEFEMLRLTKGGVRFFDGFRTPVVAGALYDVTESDALTRDGLEFEAVKVRLGEDSVGKKVLTVV